MNFKSGKKILFYALSYLFPLIIFAQSAAPCGPSQICNPIPNTTSIPQFLQVIIVAAVQIGTIVGTLAIIYAGFLYATAQGDEEKLNKAKNTLLWAAVGTAILIGAQVIIAAVSSTVGGITGS